MTPMRSELNASMTFFISNDAFYFDGRATTGFSSPPYIRIVSPLGDLVLGPHPMTQDAEFLVVQPGTNIVAIEGRSSDSSTNGNED